MVLSIDFMSDLNLISIDIKCLLFLLPKLFLVNHLLNLKLILYLFESLIVLPLLLPLEMLEQIMLLDLTVTDEFLFLHEPLYLLLLLPLLAGQVLLVLADDLEVVQVVLLRLLLGRAVVTHLLLQLLLHPLLVLSNAGLHRVLLLLELLHIVHDDLCPVVWVLGGGAHLVVVGSRGRLEDLVTYVLDGGGAGPLGGLGEGLQAILMETQGESSLGSS
jgi:hypothetical protein